MPLASVREMLRAGWWMLLLRGVLAIAFGVMALAWPGLTITTLVLVFAAYALVEGVFLVIASIRSRKEHEDWWVLLLEGLIGVAFGILTFQHPDITALVLILYICAWAMLSGVLKIVLAVRLRKEIRGEWLLALAGVAAILFGVAVMARPAAGAVALAWIIGVFALVEGVTLVALALRLRGLGKQIEKAA